MEPGTSSAGPLSDECTAVLRGGSFDARSFLKRARPSGDSLVDEEEEMNFKCKLRCLDMLNSNPHLIQSTMQRLSDEISGLTARKATKLDDKFDAKVRRISKVPLAWKAAYLVQNLPVETKLTSAKLKEWNAKDDDTVDQVFCYLHALSGDSTMPEVCLDKLVFERALKLRMEQIGRFNMHWFQKAEKQITEKGYINWLEIGCFTISKTNTGVMIKHSSGDEAPSICSGGLSASVARFTHDMLLHMLFGFGFSHGASGLGCGAAVGPVSLLCVAFALIA